MKPTLERLRQQHASTDTAIPVVPLVPQASGDCTTPTTSHHHQFSTLPRLPHSGSRARHHADAQVEPRIVPGVFSSVHRGAAGPAASSHDRYGNRGSQLNAAQRRLLGTMRHPGQHNDEASLANRAYGEAFAGAVDRLADNIMAGTHTDLEALWSQATKWRGDWAVLSAATPDEIEDAPLFFVRRTVQDRGSLAPAEGSMTPIEGKYAGVLDLACKYRGDQANASLGIWQTYRINDREFDMSGVIGSTMVHTGPEDVPALMAHVQKLTTSFLEQEHMPTEQRMEGLGEIHWLLAQTMPNERGSAACSELVVRALALAGGCELPPCRRGFMPDLEAIASDCEGFKQRYAQGFDLD